MPGTLKRLTFVERIAGAHLAAATYASERAAALNEAKVVSASARKAQHEWVEAWERADGQASRVLELAIGDDDE